MRKATALREVREAVIKKRSELKEERREGSRDCADIKVYLQEVSKDGGHTYNGTYLYEVLHGKRMIGNKKALEHIFEDLGLDFNLYREHF